MLGAFKFKIAQSAILQLHFTHLVVVGIGAPVMLFGGKARLELAVGHHAEGVQIAKIELAASLVVLTDSSGAKGNIGGFYVEGRLISDFYLYGDSWVIDLRALPVQQGIIKIQPFSAEDADGVYLEIPFDENAPAPQVYTCRDDRLFI